MAAKQQQNGEVHVHSLGKLDAGMAILLGPNSHLLEFPSLLIPEPSPNEPPLGPGSILTITVTRDLEAERTAQSSFERLQASILDAFGTNPPTKPELQILNVTQTSVALEWNELYLGSATFRGLEMYRNGQRWGRVGGEVGTKDEKTEWKTGGLQSGEEYTFQLVMKTTAGTFPSNLIRVRTHTMDNLTGLYPTFGSIEPATLLSQLRTCLTDIGAREAPHISTATTHFVCSSALLSDGDNGSGSHIDEAYEKAVAANLPVVSPSWLLAVAAERRLVPIANYLLPSPSAPRDSSSGSAPFRRPSDLKHSSLPVGGSGSPVREQPEVRSPSPETVARMSNTGPAMSPSSRQGSFAPSVERSGSLGNERKTSTGGPVTQQRSRSPRPESDGRLDRGFKFPTSGSGSGSKPTPHIRTQLSDGDESIASPVMQTPIVHIQAPSTDGPISAPVGYTPMEEEIKEVKEIDGPPAYDQPDAAGKDSTEAREEFKGDSDVQTAPAQETASPTSKPVTKSRKEAEADLAATNVGKAEEPVVGATAAAETAESDGPAGEVPIEKPSTNDATVGSAAETEDANSEEGVADLRKKPEVVVELDTDKKEMAVKADGDEAQSDPKEAGEDIALVDTPDEAKAKAAVSSENPASLIDTNEEVKAGEVIKEKEDVKPSA
ncbi:hypothetical protein CcaverHIS002_0209720 [Cutaneotrichosporon cavernicola]|nr:hypothetical protein CcaverHIS002_0209720 [Cutaneotrichosporon cavernicola]